MASKLLYCLLKKIFFASEVKNVFETKEEQKGIKEIAAKIAKKFLTPTVAKRDKEERNVSTMCKE